MRKWIYWVIGIAFVLFAVRVMPGFIKGKVPLFESCTVAYEKRGECPSNKCEINCLPTHFDDGCGLCIPKDCSNFGIYDCPLDRCLVTTTCSNKKICYRKQKDPPACGDSGYFGQTAECCEGLTRRCGLPLEDGSCNMSRNGFRRDLPECLPCGDGICDETYENKCSCPEDCTE